MKEEVERLESKSYDLKRGCMNLKHELSIIRMLTRLKKERKLVTYQISQWFIYFILRTYR